MTIKEAINKGMIILKNNKIENPKLKARLLLQYIIKKPRQYVIVYDNKEITSKEQSEYFVNIDKIVSGIPLQHITHLQEFMKMDFYVDNNVLIPRPDTEILVEEVIKIANKKNKPIILDLCTGSGAIAISIAKNIKNVQIIASDISEKALEVAMKNAKMNEVNNKIEFIKSDLFDNIKKIKFDIIVTNPPYIKTEEIKKLSEDVKKEPNIALDGGIDGLDFYKKIINQSYEYLKYEGYLCMEIGYDQKLEVMRILEEEKYFSKIYTKKDLGGNDRVIVAKI